MLKLANKTLPPTGLTSSIHELLGKSTLLSLVSGLAERPEGGATSATPPPRTSPRAAGLTASGSCSSCSASVLLGKTVLHEAPEGPQSSASSSSDASSRSALQDALASVGMSNVALDTPVRALSGGYKRRLALAIQLVRDPHVLCRRAPGGTGLEG